METIRLPNGTWRFDPSQRLGAVGGFGEVFLGEPHPTFGEIAIKRLHVGADEAAHRELDIAAHLKERTLSYVVPVFDAGEDTETGRYYVVMAKAETSLESKLVTAGSMDSKATADVICQILDGLDEMHNVVHRDLKPANVLLHNGRFKLADFGIARFVEAATSSRTVRDCLTPLYAAPEQWREEHATSATDVYALGCIGYRIAAGTPPFVGASKEELRRKHLLEAAPALTGHDSRLQATIAMMLRKDPQTRPSRQRVRDILKEMGVTPNVIEVGKAELRRAVAVAETRAAQKEAEAARSRLESDERRRFESGATKLLEEVLSALRTVLTADIRELAVKPSDVVTFPNGSLTCYRSAGPLDDEVLSRFANGGWHLISGGSIAVRQEMPFYTWGSSLWYVRTEAEGPYRWREVSYFQSPLLRKERRCEPVSLEPRKAAEVHSHVMGEYCIAWGPHAIDDEHAPDFIERWSYLVALAIQGRLSRPHSFPLAREWRQWVF